MTDRTFLPILLAAAPLALGACGSEPEHGHAHEEGGEHSHENASTHGDHGHADEQIAPETKAYYDDTGEAAGTPAPSHKENHDHAGEDGEHSH